MMGLELIHVDKNYPKSSRYWFLLICALYNEPL